MSQKKSYYYDTKYKKNMQISRSPQPINKTISHIRPSNIAGRYSTISVIKQTESSLLNENQSFYRFRYILQDKPDDTNIVFFDSNSRKFRTRSLDNMLKPKQFSINSNKITASKIGQNNKNSSYTRNMNYSKERGNINLIYNKHNNEKNGMKTENVSNKMNLIKINEKNVKNPQYRAEIIKQLKQEKDELIGKSNSNKKNQQYNRNNNSNISSNQKSTTKKINNDNNNNQTQNKVTGKNQNYLLSHKSVGNNQKTPTKNKQENLTNKNLYSNIQSSNPKEQNQQNNYNISPSDKPMNIPEEQNKNPKIQTSERKEERTIVLVPGQTIEKKNMVENFENPTEELVENPDGTLSSIIKQTKVTTITENIPIQSNKIKTVEGAPELPMYKQHMTHIYKTVISVSPKTKKEGKYINKHLNEAKNLGDNFCENGDNIGKKGYNFGEKGDNIGQKKAHFGEKGDNIIQKKAHFNEKGENIGQKGTHFGKNEDNIGLKGDKIDMKKEKEAKKISDSLTKKGDKVSSEEKEKQFNNIKDLLNNISKGKNSEENMKKLEQLLLNMNEEDRKEILEKLKKNPKNVNLLKKLETSIQKQNSNNDYNYTHNQNAESGNNKESSHSKNFGTGFKSLVSENVDIEGINPLKFDGLFLDMSKYSNEKKEKNPFEGPSPYIELYKERRDQIKKKLNYLASSEIGHIETTDTKQKGKI